LQFDFNWQLAGKGAAAFVASQRITNPAFGGGPLRPVHSLFTNQFTDEARLVLPLRLAYLPEAIKASVGVLHELRHLENSLRRLRHEDFPFYGEAFFPLGLNQFFESDSEKTSLFAKIYGRFFSLEENDTITENFFYLRDILDDPLAIFNRELDEGFMESEFKVDIQNLTLANKVSKAIGESVMSVIAKPDSAKTIQFIERDGIVWGKVISTLTPGKMKTTFILSVPLVAALPQQSRADHLEALRKQMEFMLVNLQNRAVFVEWLNSLDQLRNSEEFKGVSFKDFLRNQFLLSPDKNGLTSASSGPQEVASPALMNVINGSTVTALEHVDQILQGIGQPIGYSNMATWMESNRGQVRPVMYVVLYAEALVAKKSITEVENQFPEARGMAQYLITHMESAHANLMSRFMFRFSTF
ncbi:MAG: hypothetical protein ACXWQE_14935, partial [Bdellovibrionales bacterium]